MLPTFLVIGAQKAGTTSLHAYLGAHPEVFVADKETNFFTDLEYDRGLDWYRTLFASAGDASARGDVSPLYTAHPWLPNVPERVAKHLPGVKLIYLIRHPVERAISAYRFMVAEGQEARPIEDAILRGDLYTYISRGHYSLQIEQWLPHIDRDDLLVVVSEQLRADRIGTMRRIFAHIGVDPEPTVISPIGELYRTEDIRQDRAWSARLKSSRAWRNFRVTVPVRVRHAAWRLLGSRRVGSALQRAELSPDARRQLVNLLRPDLERLRGYVGDDFDCWRLLDDPLA